MKINGKITLLFSDDGMLIELHDDNAALTFVRIKLNQKQTCQVLSRLSHTDCQEMEINGIENIGKKYEHKNLSFEMSKCEYGKDRGEKAYQEALKQCPEGWSVINYFNSQNSFDYISGGKVKVNCTICRWVGETE